MTARNLDSSDDLTSLAEEFYNFVEVGDFKRSCPLVPKFSAKLQSQNVSSPSDVFDRAVVAEQSGDIKLAHMLLMSALVLNRDAVSESFLLNAHQKFHHLSFDLLKQFFNNRHVSEKGLLYSSPSDFKKIMTYSRVCFEWSRRVPSGRANADIEVMAKKSFSAMGDLLMERMGGFSLSTLCLTEPVLSDSSGIDAEAAWQKMADASLHNSDTSHALRSIFMLNAVCLVGLVTSFKKRGKQPFSDRFERAVCGSWSGLVDSMAERDVSSAALLVERSAVLMKKPSFLKETVLDKKKVLEEKHADVFSQIKDVLAWREDKAPVNYYVSCLPV